MAPQEKEKKLVRAAVQLQQKPSKGPLRFGVHGPQDGADAAHRAEHDAAAVAAERNELGKQAFLFKQRQELFRKLRR